MITTEKLPDEFLVRWRDGKISGAHIVFKLVTLEDGEQIGVTLLPAQAIAIGVSNGFPLANILKQIHIDALSEMDAAKAELETAQAEIESCRLAVEQANARIYQLEKDVETAMKK